MKKQLIMTALLILTVVKALWPAKGDSLRQNDYSLLFLPVVFYTPETRLALGAAMHYCFNSESSFKNGRPSSLLAAITYTQNHQILNEINPDFYWRNGSLNLKGRLSYTKFPTLFYGIGNKTKAENKEYFTPQTVNVKIQLKRKMVSALKFGLHYEFEKSRIIKIKPHGLLDQTHIVGKNGGQVSGLGFDVDWDSRNHIFFPTSGAYYRFSVLWFKPAFLSQFRFNKYQLDLRKYYALTSNQVIALQFYLQIITGKPPFQQLSLLGGRQQMRGYFEGRFRDRQLGTIQFEYRFVPVWWKLGLVAFLGAGDVAPDLQSFRLQNLKYSAGIGVRYLVRQQDRIHLRLDVGFGQKSSGVYITFGEAF